MMFKVGDKVVHPKYGLGNVTKLEEREFEPGVMRRYYEISIHGTTLWVPLDLPTFGLRKLSAKAEISRCRKILASQPAPLPEDARQRQSDLADRLKKGTIASHCEVVRDLYASVKQKPLGGLISSFLQVTQDVLCQEWAAVEGITLSEAVTEVGFLLEKSRLTMTEAAA